MRFKIGKTYYNFYGPFYTLFRTQARITDHILRGELLSAGDDARKYLYGKGSIPIKLIPPGVSLATRGVAYDYGDTLAWTDPKGLTVSAFERTLMPITLEEIVTGLLEGRPESLMDFFGIVGRPDYDQLAREAEESPLPISIKRPRTSTGGTGPLGIIGTPAPQTDWLRQARREQRATRRQRN